MPQAEPAGTSIEATTVLMLAWLVGVVAGRMDWLDAETHTDPAFHRLSETPVVNEADQGARDALRWLAAGAAVAARTAPRTGSRPVPVHPSGTREAGHLRSAQRLWLIAPRNRRILFAHLFASAMSLTTIV